MIRGKLKGFAYSLVVAYCNGLYSGASISLNASRSYLFHTRPGVAGEDLNLAVFEKGAGSLDFVKDLSFNPLSRPYYVLQANLYAKGALPRDPESDAWTGVFNYTIPWNPFDSECGYAKSLPIPTCSVCNGFCGAITSHVSLTTIRHALQERDGLNTLRS